MALLSTGIVPLAHAHAQRAPRERWLATWAPSMQPAAPRPPADSVDRVYSVINRTLRQIAHVSLGGTRVRIRISNEYGDKPLFVRTAHIALSRGGSAIDSATDHALTFSGRASVVIRAGASMVSNVKLPASLAGRGEVRVELSVDGRIANAVKVAIK